MLYSLHPRWLAPALCLAAFTTLAGVPARAAAPDTDALLKQGRSAGLCSALAAHLMDLEKTGTPEALIKDDAYRTALAAHEVLRVTGDKSLAALSAKYPDFNNFLAAFLRDREWMEAYLASGNVPTDTEHGLGTLFRLWKAEGASADFGKYKQLSAAIGSAWGGEGKRAEQLRAGLGRKPYGIDPVWRFRFFRDGHKLGRMHPMFAGLKSWELLYVVEKVWDDAGLAWANENINVPLQRYPDAFNAVRYRGQNDFGDTIQGPLFYKPWEKLMNKMENDRMHGGVCGDLSTFGATAASAHGIPSYTCGQPSHCAYAVRLARGDWRGGFGGPDGSPHTFIWHGNIHFVNLMEAVFGDDAGLALALTHGARSRLLAGAGDIAGAEKAIDAALAASPFHLDLRREQFVLLEKSGRMKPADWSRLAEALLVKFGDHSDPALALIGEFEPKFLGGTDDAAKLAWYAKFHAAAARAPMSFFWSYELEKKHLPAQFAALNSEASREALLKLALSAHNGVAEGVYFGKVLEWGVKSFVEKGKPEVFGRAFSEALGAGGAAAGGHKRLQAGYEKALDAVCAAQSIPAFQSLGKAALVYASKAPGPAKLELPSGKLVSAGGVPRPSSRDRCSPVDYYNVLNETGGQICTKEEATPWVTVELPGTAELSGILLVKGKGRESAMKKVRVSRSVDGATWFPVEATSAMPGQWRITPPAGTNARWIKVEALNDKPAALHLRNILVFSKE